MSLYDKLKQRYHANPESQWFLTKKTCWNLQLFIEQYTKDQVIKELSEAYKQEPQSKHIKHRLIKLREELK